MKFEKEISGSINVTDPSEIMCDLSGCVLRKPEWDIEIKDSDSNDFEVEISLIDCDIVHHSFIFISRENLEALEKYIRFKLEKR